MRDQIPETGHEPCGTSDLPCLQAVRKLSADHFCDSDQEDDDTDYEIGYANDKLISMSWNSSSYCHGAAHGMGSYKSENIVLRPKLHALEQADIFGPGNAWQPALQKLFWQALQERGWSPPPGQEDSVKSELFDQFIKPENWIFTSDGLQVLFSSYDGGCYACTPDPVTVSWPALKPLLAPDSIVP